MISPTTLSSRELNQDIGQAKRAARLGPVFITDRGKPAHVMMTIEQYRLLTGASASIIDMLALPEGVEAIDFEAPRANISAKPVDLS